MRKVVKRPDGTEEAIEGTPVEVREYERIVKNDRAPKEKSMPQPGLIKGKDSDRQIDSLRRAIEKMGKRPSPDTIPTWPWPHIDQKPVWIAACSLCRGYPCRCLPFYDPTRIYCGSDAAIRTVMYNSNGTSTAARLGGPTPFEHEQTIDTAH